VIRNILLLCTGNICRSPMAEGLLREFLPTHQIFSAGVQALEGAPPDNLAVALMKQSGIDISEHRARSLAGWMMQEADLVLTMDNAQKQIVLQRYPAVGEKVERLAQSCDIDIPDPYQRGWSAFCDSLSLIKHALQSRLPDLTRGCACSLY
jgi:protein-tyrosine phosphatase